MNRQFAAVGLAGLLAVGAYFGLRQTDSEPAPPLEQALAPMGPDRVQIPLRIGKGSTLGTMLSGTGFSANAVREAALEHYDLARIRPDRELTLVYSDAEPEPVALSYVLDEDRTLFVEQEADALVARVEEVQYEVALDSRHLVLESSLWQAGLDAGLRPIDLVRLAEIFEYELDFNTELREGATFDLVAEVLSAAGRKSKLGALHAVRLVNGDKEVVAVRHLVDDEETFYHPDGTGMTRPFLRSPLEFSARVTSAFNPKRFHPVLKTRRPHNGTDFGAPTGTRVRSVAAGTVTYAGRNGGHGNYVKIKHEGPHETSYSHLSKIKVKKGATVRQGQLIGLVGTTGLSTGPHLHYQMWKNGRYVDAMNEPLPSSTPIARSKLAAFKETADRYVPMLDSAPE
ncbi:MAG: M23 family metallopeptidase [Proteobacteria bacterium]|nr:M23 family metallopeptidase [Pseudomonadota bacterium]